ncbi:hypothetical protein [Celeribacter indicus]|uniref:Peptidylglycine alpha-amidating monooxygenase n=1 Tax=Celeribacter indicus TaxID=1208324 RepID=A0A0B5E478_9RHOB|nr:hypothetical protein [Celeribacter indicus]AJE47866.1 peptidylglycine alpha-amidating monooxygenase [Celeribacter indicus]SDW25368.1 peptidylglycine monooxygenase [Celeribacter indicus]
MRSLFVRLADTTYRVERPFFAPEPSQRVSDVAVDAEGRVHVLLRVDPLTHPPIPAVVVLDPEGCPLERYGEEVLDAHGLTIAPDGGVWVVDRDAHRLLEYRGGRLARSIGRPDRPGEPFNHPTAVAFGSDGAVVAGGYADASVHVLDSRMEPLRRFGRLGRAPDALSSVHAVWQSPAGSIYVVDRNNDAIKRFSATGELLAVYDAFFQPQAVTGRGDGTLLVTDTTPTLTLMSPDLQPLAQCRPVDSGAHGVSKSPCGTIYLAEPAPSRVSRLVPI